jgi:large subunit ribosomal protein L3
VRTPDRDGYGAVQLGYGQKKPNRSIKPEVGHAERAGLDYVPAITREFKLAGDDRLADDPHTPLPQTPPAESAENDEDTGAEAQAADAQQGMRVGQVLTVGIFAEGERVKVTGKTKGRGFQGVIKRHGFAGFPKSHGHPEQRLPGSIGPGTDPSRVIKGRRMGGHMGTTRKTVRNLTVVKIDAERNLLFVKGSVPGAPNGWVFIGKQ